MPKNRDSIGTGADVEALEWIVALQEAPDDEDVRGRFEQWRAESRANAAAWQEAAQVYFGIGETNPIHSERWTKLAEQRPPALAAPISAVRKRRHIRPTQSRRRMRGPLVKIALPSAAAAVLAVFAVPEVALRWQADEVADAGELRDMTLADGSLAALAPGSAIEIDYSSDERRIRLLRGQAWFDVKEDDRPFRVAAGDVETIDIGTAFEVDVEGGSVRVAVGHGIVRVNDAKAERVIADRLTAGHVVSVGSDGNVRRTTTSPELIGAWRDGQLIVQDRPMGEVIDALRPWYSGKIIVRSDTLARRRVTGVYDLRDPAGAMEALSRAYGGKVRRITPWMLVLSED